MEELAEIKEFTSFEKLMELSTFLSKSTIVPSLYQNRPENCYIAIDMASRMGITPMMVMQNLDIISGKPSWKATAVAALIKADPSLKDVELVYVGEEGQDSWGAYVQATDVNTGKTKRGQTVTVGIAKREGWFSKTGSKWQTMTGQMLGYRAYSWFGRMYCSERLMGLQSDDEIKDVIRPKADESALNPFLLEATEGAD